MPIQAKAVLKLFKKYDFAKTPLDDIADVD